MSGAVLPNVSAVALDGRAIIIEGPPGSGKTSLALAMIDRGATLIGDDAVTIERSGSRIVVSPPPNIAGQLEVRNIGIVELPCVDAMAALILVLDPAAPRFPLEVRKRDLLGVAVPLLPFAAGDAIQAIRAEYALGEHGLRFPPAIRTA